jgi:hypothetical protein
MNPHTSEADGLKQVAALKMAIKDFFPVTASKIKELG